MKTQVSQTPTQVFSCEFCEIFKNTLSTEHLRAAASIRRQNVYKKNLQEHPCKIHIVSSPNKNVYKGRRKIKGVKQTLQKTRQNRLVTADK